MKAAELREKTTEDLNKDLLELLKEQFNLRMQKASGQLGQTHLQSRFVEILHGLKLCWQKRQVAKHG